MPYRTERDRRTGRTRRMQTAQENPKGFDRPDATESNDAYLDCEYNESESGY